MKRYLWFVLVFGLAVECRVASAQAPTCSLWRLSSPTVRAEGVAELVSDAYVYCSGGTPVANGAPIPTVDMKLTFNANVASRVIGSDGVSTEALMLLDLPATSAQFPCEQPNGVCPAVGNGNGGNLTDYYGTGSIGPHNRNVYQGTLNNSTSLVFKSIPFDPPGVGNTRYYLFNNLRVDATSLPASATDVTLSVTVTSSAGSVAVSPNSVIGAKVLPSLTAQVLNASGGTAVASGVTLPVGTAVTQARVATLHYESQYFGADKTRTSAPYNNADTSPAPVDQNLSAAIYGTESGFFNSTFGTYGTRGNLATAGLADSGTRYMAVFNNVPSGVNVFVDIYNSTGAAGPTARLISAGANGTGAFAAVPGTSNKAQLVVSGGKAVAIWEVLRTSDATPDQFDFGVYLSYPAATTAPPATDIQMMYAPTGGHATPPTSGIPVFSGVSTAQNLFTYTLASVPLPNPTPAPAPAPSSGGTSTTPPDPSQPPAFKAPQLLVTPLTLAFVATVGGPSPAAQYLQIKSDSTTSLPVGFNVSSGTTIPVQPSPSDSVTYRAVAINLNTKGMAAGTYTDTINVTNSIDGTVTPVAVTFTLSAGPQISTLSVAAVQAGSPGFTLAVNGSGLSKTYVIRWNGTPLTTTWVSDGQLTAPVAASLIQAVGTATVTVTAQDGSASNSLPFAIEKIALSSLAPLGATAGDAALTLTIAGTGLVTGSTVKFAGTALTPTSVSSNKVVVSVPAELLAADATIPVSVVSPGGTVSNSIPFVVSPVFRIDAISPSSVQVGGPAFQLEISGTGFVAGTTVQLGTLVLRPDSVTGEKIIVSVFAAMITRAGPLSVSVLRSGMPLAAAPSLTITPLPAILSLTPAALYSKGPDLTLTVSGTAFVTGSTVRWNAQSLTTTMVSSTQLTAIVPAALTASPGSALVDISIPGNTYSNAVTIRINGPAPPALITLTPSSVPVGTTPVSITLSGTDFASGCAVVFTPPSALAVRVVTDSCTSTQVVVRLPGSVLGAVGSGQIQVLNTDGQLSAPLTLALVLPPFPAVSFTAPFALPSGQDQPVTLVLNGAYPVDVQGKLTMTFTPNGNMTDDPSIQFNNGSRVLSFTIPAGTQPQIQAKMKSGTVAGRITIVPAFTVGGQDVTPAGDLTQRMQIAPAEPTISLFTCTRTPSGFVAVVEGFTNTRSATQASFDLQSDSGASLGTSDLGSDTPLLFSGWFNSQQSTAAGGVFRYTQPFTLQSDATKVASATVKLSNAVGISALATCQVQ